MNTIKSIYKGSAFAAVTMLCACSSDDVTPSLTQAYCPSQIQMLIPDDVQKYIYQDANGSNVLPMLKGQSVTMGVTIGPDSATYKDAVWNSSNTTVAAVENGTIQALSSQGSGYTIVSVLPAAMSDASGVVDKLKVTVDDELTPADTIRLSADTTEIYIGEQLAMNFNIIPENTTYHTLAWSSSDEAVATVSNKGVVTGVNTHGDETRTPVTITGTSLDGTGINGTFQLYVRKQVTPTQITLDTKYSADNYACCMTERSVKLDYTTVPAESTKSLITWSSSDETIATVKDGVVTLNQNGKFGEFTITATCPDGTAASLKMNMPAGLIRETFSNKNDYTWNATTANTSKWVADANGGHLQVTTTTGSFYRQDFQCTEAATYICPGNYPIIAIRMDDVKDLDAVDSRNISFDTTGKDLTTGISYSGIIGVAANKYSRDIICNDGSHIFYYDLSKLNFQKAPDSAGKFPADGTIGKFTKFQIKYADFKKSGSNIAAPVTYNVYWIQSFKSAAECNKYLKEHGLID